MISEPGIYDLPARDYHADPVVEPSLSRSIAWRLVDLTADHARHEHPRLGGGVDAESEDAAEPAAVPAAKEDRDIGTAVHRAFLRGEAGVAVLDVKTYQSKAAKEQRDEAIRAGLIPIKRARHDDMLRMLDKLERFRGSEPGAFTAGRAEQVLVWQEGKTWCRSMVDWLPDDPSAPLWDLKTTGGRAKAWPSICYDKGLHLQTPFYTRGAAAVRDGEIPDGLRYCVIENKPPYGIKVFGLSDPAGLELAEHQADYAIEVWTRCLAENNWPSYPLKAEWIDPPVWVVRDWEWRQLGGGPRPTDEVIKSVVEQATVKMMVERGNLAG